MIKAVLVDDEMKSTLTLQKLLAKHCPDFTITGFADTIEDAAVMIKEKDPDVVFLDIELTDGTGFDLLARFDDPFFHFIFVTAHSNYAVKAFRYSAVDYLLKPVDIDDLKNAANKIRKAIRNGIILKQQPLVPGKILRFRTKKDFIVISTDQIVRLEASGSYTVITLMNMEQHTVSVNLGVLEEKIADKHFVRVHRSDTININHISRILKDEGLYVELARKIKVEISRRNKAALFAAIGEKDRE